MSQGLKVSFDQPASHWLAIHLDAEGRLLELPFSYTPFDFLSELIRALLAFSDGLNAVANCSYNPERYEFIFEQTADGGRFQVVSYPDHRKQRDLGAVIFDYKGGRADICLAFWRGIRELQGRVPPAEYVRGFGREFPEQEMKLLTERLKH